MKALETSPPLALDPYTQLRNISRSLKAAQPSADGAAPHLVDRVEQVATLLRSSIAQAYGKKLENVTEKMKWPSQNLELDGSLIEEWAHWCGLLLDLQEP